MELALIENLQRENLDPIEEAEAFAVLKDKYKLTQKQISTRIGKSRSVVANSLRLLKLPALAISSLKSKKISSGHARVLAGLDRSTQILSLLDKVIKRGLSVRQTEELVSLNKTSKVKHKPRIRPRQIINLENKLISKIGTKVKISMNQSGKGKISIDFYSQEDLQRILDIIDQ